MRKQSGSPPPSKAGPAPNADPDASRAEDDRNETVPLLDRLQALEVTSDPSPLRFLSLSLSSSFPASSFSFIFSSSHRRRSSVASPSASRQSPRSVTSESVTARQSRLRNSRPARGAAGAPGFTPSSVCFPLRSGSRAASASHASVVVVVFNQSHRTHRLASLLQLKDCELIK